MAVEKFQLGLYDPAAPEVMIAAVGPPWDDALVIEQAVIEYRRATRPYATEALALGVFAPQLGASVGAG